MAQPLSTHETFAASRPASGVRLALLWGGAAPAVIVVLGALTLWYHYGTAVFFEMIAASVSACF